MSASRDRDAPPVTSYLDPRAAAHPQPFYREQREGCPVARLFPGTGPFLYRYEDILFALKHPEIFSARVETGMIGNDRPLIPLQLDPPDQTKYRRLLDPLFLRKAVLPLEPDVRALVNRQIDGFIDAGECEFARDFAIPLPCTVFLRLMGLPLDDLDLFLELKDGVIRPEAETFAEAEKIRARTGQRIYAYFEKFIDERMRSPKDDMFSHLLAVELEGEKLTREEILDISFLLLIGGLDTVTATLGCSFVYLARHPEQRQQIVDDPDLIPAAMEELLRWETPVMQVVRVMTRDHTLGGVELKKGERVTLVLGSADTDPEAFADPERVEFARERNRHLAFGGGAHRCLGSHLARMELDASLREFHRRIPHYAIKAGETPVYRPAIREVAYLPLVFEPGGSGRR